MSKRSPDGSRTASRFASADLLRQARAGQSQALNRLFSRYLPKLQRWAHGRLPNWARNGVDTNDIVQETVLHTIRNLDGFEPQREGALLGYLRRSLINRVRSQFRHAARHPAASELTEALADAGASPLDFTINADNQRRYHDALTRLSAADRRAIVARVEMGCSYEQLALILRKPTAEAARLAVRRALLRLADELRPQ